MDTEILGSWFKFGAALAAFLAGCYFGFKQFVKYFKKKKTKKNEDRFNEINMKIWEILCELRMHAKSSRVSLVQFHNGGKFVDGSSMRRMSITHQTCDPKVTSTMQFKQDVLVSRFIEIIEMLQSNDPRVRNVSTQYDSNTKKFHELHDTMAFSILPIYCPDSLMAYGYINIEWCDLEILDKVDEKEFEPYFENARNQIGFLLSSCKDYR